MIHETECIQNVNVIPHWIQFQFSFIWNNVFNYAFNFCLYIITLFSMKVIWICFVIDHQVYFFFLFFQKYFETDVLNIPKQIIFAYLLKIEIKRFIELMTAILIVASFILIFEFDLNGIVCVDIKSWLISKSCIFKSNNKRKNKVQIKVDA